MGKSPAKWFRSVLLGKKSSKSGIPSKKSVKNKGSLVSSKESASNLSTDLLSLVPETLPVSTLQLKEDSNSVKGEAEKSLSGEVVNTSINQNDSAGSASEVTVNLTDDLEKLQLVQAATKAQAAYRGYRARQAFQTVKRIVKLQAQIRGHLVRRQAVSTLNSILGVVKIQALVRGQIGRRSNFKGEVFTNQALGHFKTKASIPADKLLDNAFTKKLLSWSPNTVPLQLHYGPEEPNSGDEWLKRWTISKVWIPQSEPKHISDPNHQTSKIDDRSNHLSSEAEKVKSNSKATITQHSAKSVSEIEKIRINLKKISKPIIEESACPEADTDSSMQNLKQPPTTTDDIPRIEPDKYAVVETLVQEGFSMVTSHNEFSSIQSKVEPTKPDDVETHVEKLSKTSPGPIAVKNHEEDVITSDNKVLNSNHKNRKRRVSLPLKCDIDSGTHPTTRKLPSYMTPTQSARAKMREQASPRDGQDGLENITVMRRYSMPSLSIGKMSSSPRIQKHVIQASGKEGIKIDRSLSTSRDGSDKAIRAEWKR
ncbi:unnamed protein product [Cuscuta europaea]|uniref:DUF4005 domain-containing protein n=1 Tax=Cuscuta europaea TaxID=41803 RepID=A0A9P0ZWR4_CUSEU|nr:unnamed protein product [Cuscuta europaea]